MRRTCFTEAVRKKLDKRVEIAGILYLDEVRIVARNGKQCVVHHAPEA